MNKNNMAFKIVTATTALSLLCSTLAFASAGDYYYGDASSLKVVKSKEVVNNKQLLKQNRKQLYFELNDGTITNYTEYKKAVLAEYISSENILDAIEKTVKSINTNDKLKVSDEIKNKAKAINNGKVATDIDALIKAVNENIAGEYLTASVNKDTNTVVAKVKSGKGAEALAKIISLAKLETNSAIPEKITIGDKVFNMDATSAEVKNAITKLANKEDYSLITLDDLTKMSVKITLNGKEYTLLLEDINYLANTIVKGLLGDYISMSVDEASNTIVASINAGKEDVSATDVITLDKINKAGVMPEFIKINHKIVSTKSTSQELKNQIKDAIDGIKLKDLVGIPVEITLNGITYNLLLDNIAGVSKSIETKLASGYVTTTANFQTKTISAKVVTGKENVLVKDAVSVKDIFSNLMMPEKIVIGDKTFDFHSKITDIQDALSSLTGKKFDEMKLSDLVEKTIKASTGTMEYTLELK